MSAITMRAFGSVAVLDCAWTVTAVRNAVRVELRLDSAPNVTLGTRAGVVAHVDAHGDLLVVYVAREK